MRGNVEPPDLSVHDVVMEVTPVSSEPVPQDASGPIIEDTARPESRPVTISENVEKSETDCRKGKTTHVYVLNSYNLNYELMFSAIKLRCV